MGGRHSRAIPTVYPNPDTIFIDNGSIGLLRREYDNNIMQKAPFLFYYGTFRTYPELIDWVVNTIRYMPTNTNWSSTGTPGNPKAKPPILDIPANPNIDPKNSSTIKLACGPIYLFVAYDLSKIAIEAYLYFPSISSDFKKIESYFELAIAHKWIARFLYNKTYDTLSVESKSFMRMLGNERKQPISKYMDSNIDHLKFPNKSGNRYKTLSSSFILGCRIDKTSTGARYTDADLICVESTDAHKRMGIYDDRKTREMYPGIYFRKYTIDIKDIRISNFVNQNNNLLRQNILPVSFTMFVGCDYMLISNNNRYYLTLSDTSITIYNNPLVDLHYNCKFKNRLPANNKIISSIKYKKGYNTYLSIEEGKILINSQATPDDQSQVILELDVAIPDNTPTQFYCLVLEDNGELNMYNINNKIVTSPNFSLNSNTQANNNSGGYYDKIIDYNQRFSNLLDYLTLRRLLIETKDVILQKINSDNSNNLININEYKSIYGSQIGELLPPYDSTIDYSFRLKNLILYLNKNGYNIDINNIPELHSIINNGNGSSENIDTSSGSNVDSEYDPDAQEAQINSNIAKKQAASEKQSKTDKSFNDAMQDPNVDSGKIAGIIGVSSNIDTDSSSNKVSSTNINSSSNINLKKVGISPNGNYIITVDCSNKPAYYDLNWDNQCRNYAVYNKYR